MKKPELFNKLKNSRDSGAGYDLVANIIVGLGIVWVVRYFWPELPRSVYGFGVVFGAISGFYQLFRSQSDSAKKAAADKSQTGNDDAPHAS